jgi:hypothetical protein
MAPIDFPIAPTLALPAALEKAELKASDISLFEINEAFSVVVRVAEKVLQLDPAKINVNGLVHFCILDWLHTDMTITAAPSRSATPLGTRALVSLSRWCTRSSRANMGLRAFAMGLVFFICLSSLPCY